MILHLNLTLQNTKFLFKDMQHQPSQPKTSLLQTINHATPPSPPKPISYIPHNRQNNLYQSPYQPQPSFRHFNMPNHHLQPSQHPYHNNQHHQIPSSNHSASNNFYSNNSQAHNTSIQILHQLVNQSL